METLKDGSQVFYVKAGKSFSGAIFFLIVSLVFAGFCYVTTKDFFLKVAFGLLSVGGAVMFLYFLFRTINKSPLVTIGRDYLLLFNHKVRFNEIDGFYKYKYGPAGSEVEMIEIKVKDPSKFPPTGMQKFAAKLGHPLFIIAIGTMSPYDAQTLEMLLSNIMPLQQGRNI